MVLIAGGTAYVRYHTLSFPQQHALCFFFISKRYLNSRLLVNQHYNLPMLTIILPGACRSSHVVRRHNALLGIGSCRYDRSCRSIPPWALVASGPRECGVDPARVRCG